MALWRGLRYEEQNVADGFQESEIKSSQVFYNLFLTRLLLAIFKFSLSLWAYFDKIQLLILASSVSCVVDQMRDIR